MRITFSTRLILSVVIIQILILGLLIWNSVRLINESHTEILKSTSREQSVLLASAISPGLIAYDHAMMEDILLLLEEQHNLLYADIFDQTGNRIVSIGDHPRRNELHDTNVYHETHIGNVFSIQRNIKIEGQHMGTIRMAHSTENIASIISEFKWQNTTIAIVGMLSLTIATIIISTILTSRLRLLQTGVDTIKEGNLEHKILMAENDEFGDLASAFNQMAFHLSSTQEQLKSEHQNLLHQSARLSTLLDNVDAVIWESNITIEKLTFVSQEARDLLGFPLDEWFDRNFIHKHTHLDDQAPLKNAIELLEEDNNQVSIDVRLLKSDNKITWTRIIASSNYDRDKNQRVIRGLIIDINTEKNREKQIIYLAEHDSLTGLINRRHFQERLNHHIAYAQRYNHESSLLFIDLDQFKYINDTFGHQAGDAYLIQAAELLQKTVRDTDILGRLGGDEFGVILPFSGTEDASLVASNLVTSFSENIWHHEGQQVHINASIGLTILNSEDKNAGQLLAEADTAMYMAKSQGRNRYHVFSEEEHGMKHMTDKVEIETMIRDALKHDRFVLHYQPIVNLSNDKISHHEALIRILDNDNLIPPVAFINIAERFGLIHEIDRWVFTRVIHTIHDSIQENNARDIAVNLSGQHIDNNSFQSWIREMLNNFHGVAEHLIIEITETAAVENLVSAMEFIESLHKLGCRFALDDFGTGFSSFHYIKSLPINYIKIDGSFVNNLHSRDDNHVFVKAIVDIANNLDIKTIAEFVENEEIVNILRDIGADMGQGYHLGRPSPDFID